MILNDYLMECGGNLGNVSVELLRNDLRVDDKEHVKSNFHVKLFKDTLSHDNLSRLMVVVWKILLLSLELG